jgi:hypothetical protein
MPILPLDHPEPSFATLGVMLYPALNEADPPKARAYVAQVLAKAFSSFRDADETPPYDVLTPILMDAGEPLSDLQERWWGGRAAGELFKTFFALSNTDPVLASWANAIKIVDSTTKSSKVKGARTKLLEARDRFLSVAHLWAARAIRGATPVLRPEIEYDTFGIGDRTGTRRAQRADLHYRQTSGRRLRTGNHRPVEPAGLKRA